MSKGNKGLWNSPRKLLLLAAVAVATAMPLQAQVDTGSVTFRQSENVLQPFISSFGIESPTLNAAIPGYVTPVPSTNAGTLTLTGNTTLSPDSPLLLAHEGTGTLTLSGSNTYSGATTVSSGILQINPPSNPLPPLNPDGILQLAPSTLIYSGFMPYIDIGTISNGGIPLLSSTAPEPTPSVEEETTTPTAPATITLTVIPEPSTLALLIGTALSAGWIRSRRKLT